MNDPELRVRQVFELSFPGETVVWTRLTADEPDRWVVGVFYGTTRPPRYSFWALRKTDGLVTRIENEAPYRPQNWR